MKIVGYSELSKDTVYLLSMAEFEKQKVITTEYSVKVLGSYEKQLVCLIIYPKETVLYS